MCSVIQTPFCFILKNPQTLISVGKVTCFKVETSGQPLK